jgi:hypothetical protein
VAQEAGPEFKSQYEKKKKKRKALNSHAHFISYPGLPGSLMGSAEVGTSGCYNSRGMQEPQGILVVHVGPLLQEGIDVWQASPLPAGGAGEHQGE